MSQVNDKLVQRLHSVLRPFILRRLKKEVETQVRHPPSFPWVTCSDRSGTVGGRVWGTVGRGGACSDRSGQTSPSLSSLLTEFLTFVMNQTESNCSCPTSTSTWSPAASPSASASSTTTSWPPVPRRRVTLQAPCCFTSPSPFPRTPPPLSLLLPLHVSLLYTHSLLLLVPFPGIALRAGARRSALRGVGRAAGAIPRGQHDGQNCKVAAVPWRRHRCRRTTRPHCAPRAGRCGGPRRAHPRRQGVPPKPPKAGGYTPRQCAANNPRGGEAHRWRRAQVARWSTCARRSTPRSRSRPPPTS